MKKTTKREHVVTKQGNGGSYCNHCEHDLGLESLKKYEKCPSCDYIMLEGDAYKQSLGFIQKLK